MNAAGWTLLLAGFAGAWPFGEKGPDPRETAEANARAKYPAAQYFWGVGESPTSADEAESRARTKVAEQIDLSLQSTLTNLMQEEQKGTSRVFFSKVVLEERKETHFDNAQIIHCEAPRKSKDGWLATASLSRLEAQNALTQAYEDTARRFRSRAKGALETADLSAFTAAWREAWRTGSWLKLQGVRFLSIAGMPLTPETMGSKHPHAPEYPADMALFDRLDSARSARIAHQRLALALGNLPSFLPKASQILKDAGLPVVTGKADWTLSLRYEKSESESAIGEISRCRLTPTLDIKHVSGTSFSSPPIQDAAGEGYKVRDPAGACADALEKIDTAPLEPALQALLHSAFPLL